MKKIDALGAKSRFPAREMKGVASRIEDEGLGLERALKLVGEALIF